MPWLAAWLLIEAVTFNLLTSSINKPDPRQFLLQVLGEVFNCLHRAQLGSAAASGVDPQLPQLVRVPRATSSSSLSGMATPSSGPHHPSSMAQDIFGQKVQVPWLLLIR